MNSDDGSNWIKNDYQSECSNIGGQTFYDCVEEKSYSHPSNTSLIKVKPFFVSEWWGLGKSVEIEVMSNNVLSTPYIDLNENISYMILITDPKLQLYTASPDVVSRSLFSIKQNPGQYHFYLEVSKILF